MNLIKMPNKALNNSGEFMRKILCLALILLLSACNSTPLIKPKVEVVYNTNTNTASVKVIKSLSSSDKSLERLAVVSSKAVGDMLNCKSGKMKQTWINGGKTEIDPSNPSAKFLVLNVECFEL